MATWKDIEAQKRAAAYRLRVKELEEDRQMERARRAAELAPKSPPLTADPDAPSYAEGLKRSNERVKARETKSHFTGD
jgi:hypothetical protein